MDSCSEDRLDKVVNHKKQKRVKLLFRRMGISLIVLALVTMSLGLAAVIVCQHTWPTNFTGVAAGIWGSVFPLITGILLVILAKYLKRCLIIWTLTQTIFSVLFALAILIISILGGKEQAVSSLPPPKPPAITKTTASTTTDYYHYRWNDNNNYDPYQWDREEWNRWLWKHYYSIPLVGMNIVMVATSLAMLVICIYTCVVLGKMCKSKETDISFWDMWPDCCYKCQCVQCVAQPIVYYSGIQPVGSSVI